MPAQPVRLHRDGEGRWTTSDGYTLTHRADRDDIRISAPNGRAAVVWTLREARECIDVHRRSGGSTWNKHLI